MAEDLTPDAYETIRQLMRLVAANGLSELSVTQPNGLSVTVKGFSASPEPTALVPSAVAHSLPYPLPPAPRAARSTPVRGAASRKPAVKNRSASAIAMGAPMVGIYFSAPAPGEPAFIQVGDTIQVGTVIGLIEAMKVYSEVPSEVAGRVVEIIAKNGVLVQQGEPLLYVEPI